MKQTSRARIKRILEKHCIMVTAEFFTEEKDRYGDTLYKNKYAEHEVYFSQLLHRYNPYMGIEMADTALTWKRHTPMAILPYNDTTDIKEFDIVKILGREYTISFIEDVKGYYLLLSLINESEGFDA